MSRRESFFMGGLVFLLIGFAGFFLFPGNNSDYDESVNNMFALLRAVSAIFFVFAGHFFWTAHKLKDRRPKPRQPN